jgi:hypothetical protein
MRRNLMLRRSFNPNSPRESFHRTHQRCNLLSVGHRLGGVALDIEGAEAPVLSLIGKP